jgi:peptidase E
MFTKQIIAIGGGGFTPKLAMEKYIIAQTKKENPRICFLPQASNESASYVLRLYDTYLSLGAHPSWVSLFGRVEDTWKQKLLNADIIFVGGGNTKSMIALWKAWGLDLILREAYENGTVMAGVSAGMICWFEQGITDSVWPLGVVEGLGFLKGSGCPHFDSEPERQQAYTSRVKARAVVPGIALEDLTAAHYIDGALHQIVSEKASKKGFEVTAHGMQEMVVTLIS